MKYVHMQRYAINITIVYSQKLDSTLTALTFI
jgi:hypothetical protein